MAWPCLWQTLLAEALVPGLRLRETFWLLPAQDLAFISCVSKKDWARALLWGVPPTSVDHQEKVYQVLKTGCWR